MVGLYLMCKTMARGRTVYDYLSSLRVIVEADTGALFDNVERLTGKISSFLNWKTNYHGLPCVVNGKQFRQLLEQEKMLKIRQYFAVGDEGEEVAKDALPDQAEAREDCLWGHWVLLDSVGEEQRRRSRSNKQHKQHSKAAKLPTDVDLSCSSSSVSPSPEKRGRHEEGDGCSPSQGHTASGQVSRSESQEGQAEQEPWTHTNLLITANAKANISGNTGMNIMSAIPEDSSTASGQAADMRAVREELRLLRESLSAPESGQPGSGSLAQHFDELCGCIMAGREQEALAKLDMPIREKLVRQCDIGGLTALHRAARIVNFQIVVRILEIDWTQASVTTNAARAPGLWTPLMCLVEASTPSGQVHHERQEDCARRLIADMPFEALAQQNTAGNNAFHLLVNRGKDWLLDACLDECCSKLNQKDRCCCLLLLLFPSHPAHTFHVPYMFKVEFE